LAETVQLALARVRFIKRVEESGERGGRGLFDAFLNSFPPASEREARMDDPTRRCENDTGK
jgi:hypothetical protein